mmetsp:Transcript_30900/g.71991  ORF Transcript_30900/g.71991 Transcript_30900/m.71991 type:complete len:226 (-) Transcript_30900:1155-1832(-)
MRPAVREEVHARAAQLRRWCEPRQPRPLPVRCPCSHAHPDRPLRPPLGRPLRGRRHSSELVERGESGDEKVFLQSHHVPLCVRHQRTRVGLGHRCAVHVRGYLRGQGRPELHLQQRWRLRPRRTARVRALHAHGLGLWPHHGLGCAAACRAHHLRDERVPVVSLEHRDLPRGGDGPELVQHAAEALHQPTRLRLLEHAYVPGAQPGSVRRAHLLARSADEQVLVA